MKGPKGLLAEAIANALSNWFVVDQTSMEASLLSSEAGVKLHQTQVKPIHQLRIHSQTTASIRGAVQHVSFVWHWGKSTDKEGGSDWVKDVELRISGLNLVVSLHHDPITSDDAKEENPVDKKGSSGKQKAPVDKGRAKKQSTLMAYVHEQVQLILDTLTVVVEDLLLTIELPDGSSLLLGGNGLTLVSEGRASMDEPLRQVFQVTRLYCSVTRDPASSLSSSSSSSSSDNETDKDSSSNTYTVLDDISYKAQIERTEGHRLLSGIHQGLVVTGESTDAGVTVHAGSTQIEVINTLVGMLISFEDKQTTTETKQSSSASSMRSSLTELRTSVLSGTELGSMLVEDGIVDTETSLAPDSTSDTATSTTATGPKIEGREGGNGAGVGKSSSMQFPLSGVSLVLPNNVKLSLNDLVLKCQMDGSLLRLEGKSGFFVDQHPFLMLGETSLWYTDLADRKLCVEDVTISKEETMALTPKVDDEEFLFCVHARKVELDKVMEGINEAFGIYQKLVELKAGAVSSLTSSLTTEIPPQTLEKDNHASEEDDYDKADDATAIVPSPVAPAWGLEINGRVGILYEDEDSEVEMILRNVLGDLATKSLRISSIDRVLMPETFVLGKPLVNTTLQFDNSALCLNLPDILVILKEKQDGEDEPTSSSTEEKQKKNRRSNPKTSKNVFSSVMKSFSSEEGNGNDKNVSSGLKTCIDESKASKKPETSSKVPQPSKSMDVFSSRDPKSSLKTSKQAEEEEVKSNSLDEALSAGFTLPIGVHLLVDKFIALKSDEKNVHSFLQQLELKLDPTSTKGLTQASLSLEEFHHEMVRLVKSELSVCVILFDLDLGVRNLSFRAEEIMIKTGYSINDWISLAPKTLAVKERQREDKPVQMPFAHVDRLKIRVNFKGAVLGVKDSILKVDAFDGTETTTTKDLMKFYNEKVIQRVPGLLKNTEVLGANVTDNVVGYLGGALLTGATPAGGILGLAAFDGIRNTMIEGKKGRDPEDAEAGWQLADFSRGLKNAAIRATKEGAKDRGKAEGERGDAYDWATGASKDMVQYTKNNKARLAGAGAGVGGFAAGFAIGGPIGGIAGAVLASAGTQKTVEAVDVALKPNDGSAHDVNVVDINPNTWKNVQSGLLFKRRNFVNWEWRSHWFILTDEGILEYFNTQMKEDGEDLFIDSSKNPRKTLEMTGNLHTKTRDDISKPKERLFAFTIHSTEQKDPLWVLGASSEEKRCQWITALSKFSSADNSTNKATPSGDSDGQTALIPYQTNRRPIGNPVAA